MSGKDNTTTDTSDQQHAWKPRNRLGSKLPILRIEIHWAGGMTLHDPNSMCVAGCLADYPFGQPFKDRPSVLSGKPAYLYKSDDLEIPLTLDELDRFVRLALRPREALKLIETYGVFHEVHDDFYVDGKAWQSRPKSSEYTTAKRRIESAALQAELDASVKRAPKAAKRAI